MPGTPVATELRKRGATMVRDDPTTTLPAPVAQPVNRYRRVAAAQGAYFVLTGWWPLFGINSFQSVTGAKTDLWLVYTVGCLVMAIGATLLLAAIRPRITPEVITLATASAVALAGIDVVFVVRGVISWVYLLDAVAEGAIVAWWVWSYLGPPRPGATRQYTHLQRFLSRGRSVSPSPNEPAQPIR
jgi:hypothetical protein